MTFYTYWPAKKTLFHFCCNLFKVGYIFVIDCLDYCYNFELETGYLRTMITGSIILFGAVQLLYLQLLTLLFIGA